ncbi:MAG: hypothetical protein ACHRXM_12795 [Isosphaerales bacterium]
MAGRIARSKPDTATAKAPVIKTVIASEEALAEEAAPSEGSAAAQASPPDEAAPCTRSHVPNAQTRRTLRDADAGKNLTRYADEDDLFRTLGIKLGQDEAQDQDRGPRTTAAPDPGNDDAV